ncbi:tyrosine-type recombinase/integrase [Streptomyces erythrochromogenes]|uniref:tyrosine-type recombinase/integrase n=1 Tax=Streptomyces erythrochromogenes TaxID=285574 RepID=UPI0037FB6B04
MLATTAWTVHFSSRDLPACEVPSWALQITPLAWESWLDEEGILDGTPYLLSPRYECDTDLNGYFLRANQMEEPLNTQANRARAVARYLNFLHLSRGGKNWRDATEEDHRAFHYWRRQHSGGPMVAGSTWSQEVSLVNQFYGWAKGRGLVSENPIPQRAIRDRPADAKRPALRPSTEAEPAMTPATLAHDGPGEQFEWLPAPSFRRWRDVGVRGYTASGLPRPRFRGRWVSRNTAYVDLMVRTGMRISEQSTVTVWEVPLGDGQAGYRRFWLPAAIAKGGSARWVYVPAGVRRDLTDYAEFDRSLVVQEAQASKRYDRIRRPLVVADPARPDLAVRTGGATRGQAVDVRLLKRAERYRLLVDTEHGLEPAMFWLGESGMPITVSTWEDLFTDANKRCEEAGIPERAHAHLLRHTFAVITLEQLQRGHIKALGELNEAQRLHYVRIFGDPLDWVRRRLGHISQVTTARYLHALQELEMATRMALVPDSWEDPRDTALDMLGASEKPPADLEPPGGVR